MILIPYASGSVACDLWSKTASHDSNMSAGSSQHLFLIGVGCSEIAFCGPGQVHIHAHGAIGKSVSGSKVEPVNQVSSCGNLLDVDRMISADSHQEPANFLVQSFPYAATRTPESPRNSAATGSLRMWGVF